ncbi:hypothetical protein [Fredinandcohnia sp. 179-A 10B2 NHS]|uniref:hypothetical protein n=1 Tax=Fredinandcohnia sp. 179-A 10B2 NHS TaxID=3235176 RepID=UPI0039A15DC7
MIFLKIIGIMLVLFIMLVIIVTLLQKYREWKDFKENLKKYYNSKRYPFFKRWKMKRIHKKVLKEFNRDYIRHNHYIYFSKRFILEDHPKTVDFSLEKQLSERRGYYQKLRIVNEALEQINKCLEVIFIIHSIVEYFEKHIDLAHKTLEEIDKESYKFYYPELYKDRHNELVMFIAHMKKINKNLKEDRLEFYEEAIRELKAIKKRPLIERAGKIAWNILTAPVRRVVSVFEGISEGDRVKVGKSTAILLLGIAGVSLLDAIDAFDGIDGLSVGSNIDLPELDLPTVIDVGLVETSDLHFVNPHEVSGYITEDGTVVEGYFRDGDGDTSFDRAVDDGGGYLATNPDGVTSNNLNG